MVELGFNSIFKPNLPLFQLIETRLKARQPLLIFLGACGDKLGWWCPGGLMLLSLCLLVLPFAFAFGEAFGGVSSRRDWLEQNLMDCALNIQGEPGHFGDGFGSQNPDVDARGTECARWDHRNARGIKSGLDELGKLCAWWKLGW